ncbi:urease accessory protein [Gracilibacillus oryzae]|uniref:Urease accessory protein n=1 Tax=Gracilibacillus oryzae TaxID=1672701 RepID=A0A7C8L5V5_9BACI|nr:urease accessory protein UreD [Gracilibacillus oryzae]KAB8138911.1 urease accessory protein [Gracilibacillus oryzae]
MSKLKGRFQKVNLLDYSGTEQLRLEKTDQSHRVFTNYQVTGLNQVKEEETAELDFIVKKASNITVSMAEPIQVNQKHKQELSLHIEEEALLLWNNHEIMLQPNSEFSRRTKVSLEGDAEFVWAEITHLNQKEYFHYASLMEIWVEEECLAYDPLAFSTSNELIHHHGLIEDFQYTASIWYIADKLPFDEWDIQQRLSQAKHHRAGMTDLDGKGILIRWLSKDLQLLQQEVRDVLSFFDEKITEIRKWRV